MYTLEEVKKETLDYFKGDELATNVWIDKYCLKDNNSNYLESNPKHMHSRLSKELSRIEENYPNPISEDDIYKYLEDWSIIPGGSILYGCGNTYSISSLGNCFVIGNDADSYGGIMTTDQEQAQLMKRRAGVGHDLSHLRSKGTKVTNSAGSSTGASSFMNRFSETTREVAQDGRRGALMLSIDINHPDAESFIDAKSDLTKITGANISVKLDNEFMNLVKKGDHGALYLWNKIINRAWTTAEPGVLFWDNIINESPADCYKDFESKSTNPCVSADTRILTELGYVDIASTVNQAIKVWNGEEFSTVIPSITGKTDKWYIIKFSDGNELKCTPYHNFYLKGYEEDTFETQDLKIGDKLQKSKFPIIKDKHSGTIDLYTQGFYCGDGSTKRDESIIDLYDVKKDLVKYFKYRAIGENGTKVKRLYLGSKMSKTWVPNITYTIKSKLSYLAGLIDSDGALNSKDGALNITSINKDFLIRIKYLLNTLGTTGVVSLMKSAEIKLLPNGKGGLKEYQTQDCYRLVISATNVKKLMELGLNTHRVKLIANPNRDASRFITVVDIQTIDVEQELTFCFNEPKAHKGVFNGVLTGQCGEIPLCPYDSCRLLSVNLFNYVIDPFTDKARFDWEEYKKATYVAQKLMDDIIDLEAEKIDSILAKIELDPEPDEIKAVEKNLWTKIKDKLLRGRRTGLSAIGLADVFAALNITYGSEISNYKDEFIGWDAPKNSIELTEEIYKQLAMTAYECSVDMAEDRGSFLDWDLDKDCENPFINRVLKTAGYTEAYAIFGRRNIALLTIPPSGTISILPKITSGIEPLYMFSYKRKRKVDENHPNKSFKDQNGDWWEEYTVYHKEGKEEFYKGSTAYEIDPLQRVKLQATIQKWVDHSISSTINLPESASEKEISNIYMEAWLQGCKGITVYRDNCRTGVLTSINSKDKNTFTQHDAPKRHEVLTGHFRTVKVKGIEYFVIVGLYDEKPYEIFASKNSWNLSGNYDCDITKIKKNHYYLDIKDVFKGDISEEISDEEETITRMTSTALRHGADIRFIVEQLNKTKGDLTGFGKALSRVLKKYINEGTKVSGICDECKSTKIIYQDGCQKCLECGHSKCG